MKIGYPCINYSVPCRGNRTFRLASYSDERLLEAVRSNLACLRTMLEYNAAHSILFFRISSGIVPFASHPVCIVPWQDAFAKEFRTIGDLIRSHGMRISMHPDQFIVLNSPDPGIVLRSRAELTYHAAILDALGLDGTAKIQLHLGGVYGDRTAAMDRFAREYGRLEDPVVRRLVVENDDNRFTIGDCLSVHRECGIPVLFDAFHHDVFGRPGPLSAVLGEVAGTWKTRDGIPMADYSSQQPGAKRGVHAAVLDPEHFSRFLAGTRGYDMDVMLEIKEKERAAERALLIAARDPRLVRA